MALSRQDEHGLVEGIFNRVRLQEITFEKVGQAWGIAAVDNGKSLGVTMCDTIDEIDVVEIGIILPKFLTPTADSLMSDGDATFEEQFLNLPVAQAESVVEPAPVSDDFAVKAVVLVAFGVSERGHDRWPLLRVDTTERALLRQLCYV